MNLDLSFESYMATLSSIDIDIAPLSMEYIYLDSDYKLYT